MRTFVYGRPLEGFVSKVISDPFKARTDVDLQAHYDFYRQNGQLFLLNKSKRVVLNFILRRNYQDVVNELPHFFYLTVKNNCPVYSIPSLDGMNPPDYKYGDFILNNGNVCVETKSHSILRQGCIYHIYNQYKQNNLNSTLSLNILYNAIHSDFLMFDYLNFLRRINFHPNNINLISVPDLQLLHTQHDLARFFKIYDISWFLYRDTQHSYITFQLQQIANQSKNPYAVAFCRKQLGLLEANKTQSSLLVSGSKKKPIKFVEEFDLSKIDETYYNNMSDEENPEDLMSDISHWFDEH